MIRVCTIVRIYSYTHFNLARQVFRGPDGMGSSLGVGQIIYSSLTKIIHYIRILYIHYNKHYIHIIHYMYIIILYIIYTLCTLYSYIYTF